jgi:hypothetical protein
MSILISHRGNINGLQPNIENSPEYIQQALDLDFWVVVDVWILGRDHLSLGSHNPQYPVNLSFLKQNNIICRARTVETLEYLLVAGTHCFMHDRDSHVLTNGGLIWTLPGKPVVSRGILTMPEYTYKNIESLALLTCAGVCSDRIQDIKDARDRFMNHSSSKEECLEECLLQS